MSPRVETHVVDPPIDPELLAFGRAAQTAARNCGVWPEASSIKELMKAVLQAEREVDRAVLVKERFQRRFGRPVDDARAASTRLAVRLAIAQDIASSRIERVRLLMNEPAGHA